MKQTTLLLGFILVTSLAFSQNKEEAEKLVSEGIAYHDKGDFEGAIVRYDKALQLDKDNLLALNEKAYSLTELKRYDETIAMCQQAITAHPKDPKLKMVYVNYGTAYDLMKKTDKSIEIYEEGIKEFPNYYLLHFNKAISLYSVKRYKEAQLSFQQAVVANPAHAGSHSAIGRMSQTNNKTIPALLAYARFLAIEPQSARAKENLANLKNVMGANVKKTGDKSVNITLNMDSFNDSKKSGKPAEDDFSSVELFMSLQSAMDFSEKNKNKSEVELFASKIEGICSSLKTGKSEGHGFFWDYYVPYFVEMKEKKMLETFSYIAFASSENEEVMKWIKDHKKETDEFFKWSESFDWLKG